MQKLLMLTESQRQQGEESKWSGRDTWRLLSRQPT
ncbi:hypothetical protein C163_15690 [Pseudomonas sp. FGI182]|nr:hypothetical protein C163_15690 [Pseudomonas sp. FGI182]